MKTVPGVLALVFFGMAPASGQDSPLRWPVPPTGPPHEAVLPQILIGAEDLARALAAGAVPLDAREIGAYLRGHLPGAVPAWRLEDEIPWGIDRLQSLLSERGITAKEIVVLYGDPDRETIARLFWLLRWAGCPDVRILDGGLAAWRAAGHPLATGIHRRTPAAFRARPGEAVVVDSIWVAAAFGQAGVELLDVRDARGWDRWQTPPTFGAGHIPHSLPLDPRSLLPPGDGWPNPAELRWRLGALGPRAGDHVKLDATFLLYGDDTRDPRLGLGYLLLTLAGVEARLFPGGWREWAATGGLPIVRVISAAELARWLERENLGLTADRRPRGFVLFDLREARDFAIGHLPGATSLPYRGSAETFEKAVKEGWPETDQTTLPVVFYCYGIDCIRSRDAGAQAARLGFRDVLWFRGGVREWRDAGLPLPEDRKVTAAGEQASTVAGTVRP